VVVLRPHLADGVRRFLSLKAEVALSLRPKKSRKKEQIKVLIKAKVEKRKEKERMEKKVWFLNKRKNKNNMNVLWGPTIETIDIEKKSIREAIIDKIKRDEKVTIEQIISELWSDYKLLTNYFRIIVTIKELEVEGILIKKEEEIKMSEITVIEGKKVKKKKVCEVFRN